MSDDNISNLHPTIDELLGYQLRRVSTLAMTALAEALVEVDLRITETSVLHQIAQSPNITSSEIGRLLDIQRANMTPLIARLLEKGYLKTKPRDGRSQALSLTRKGRTAYQQAWHIVEQHEQHYFAALSDKERQQLSRILTQVWKHNTSD